MKNGFSLVVLALALIVHPIIACGQEIEIKGIHLGMTKEEWKKKFNWAGAIDFSIAGIPGKSPVVPCFYNDKLDEFYFRFDSKEFDNVLRSVKSKYPRLKCSESIVSNAMGASFNQVVCHLAGKSGNLEIRRFSGGDLETSSLLIISNRKFNEFLAEEKRKQGDI
jgi:hypothetical protein